MSKLSSRFRRKATNALQQTDRMSYSFDTEDKLLVQEYLLQKQSLYLKAGETNENNIVCRLYKRLDPTLAVAVTLLSNRNTIDQFVASVYLAESLAKSQY